MISIPQYLYRISARQVILASLAWLVLVNLGAAQNRPHLGHKGDESSIDQPPITNKKPKRVARAIGVVEFLPKGGVRLVPVALWLDGHYYDASLYAANPEPFALQPATVYQAQDYGEPTGLFTITLPKQVNGTWVADGLWKPELALDAKLAKDAAKLSANQPAKKASRAVMTGDSDEGPPTLRRPGSKSSDEGKNTKPPESPPSASSPSSPSDSSPGPTSGRPTLARPGDEPEAPASSADSTGKTAPSTNDDPDRPTLKASAPSKSSEAQATKSNQTTAAESSSTSNDSDPSRPVLQRGRPTTHAGSGTGAGSALAVAKTPTSAKPKSVANSAGGQNSDLATNSQRRSYPAVSDASNYETRSLVYAMSTADQDKATDQMQKLALDALRQYCTKRGVAAAPTATSVPQHDLRAYDLDFSNSATLVYTATVPVPGKQTLHGGEFDYYVTVVARQDLNGDVQKIFTSVTDSNYLDAVSRLELVGAVDADAKGRGDLLFRQYSDTGVDYALYRVFPYQLQKLFEGGASM